MTAGAGVRHPRHRRVREILEERGAELIAAYTAGATVEAVAADAGIGATALRRYFIAEGVPLRPRGGSRVRARLDAMKAELIAAYKAGVALAALAARAGVCPETLRAYLIAEGVELRRHTPRPRKSLAVDGAELAAAYVAGTSVEALAARVGVSPCTIRDRLTAEGVVLRRYTPRARMRLDGEAELTAAYEAGATTADLAARAGVCIPTIRTFLKAEGVALRDDRGRRPRKPRPEEA